MNDSAKRIADKYSDPVAEQKCDPAQGSTKAERNRNAFKDEDRKIQDRGGVDTKSPNPDLYNKINSPGKKYRQQDGD